MWCMRSNEKIWCCLINTSEIFHIIRLGEEFIDYKAKLRKTGEIWIYLKYDNSRDLSFYIWKPLLGVTQYPFEIYIIWSFGLGNTNVVFLVYIYYYTSIV